MKHPRRGEAYIFNHERFDSSLKLDERDGSRTDVSNLQPALEKLGFNVSCFLDLGICEIREKIKLRNFRLHLSFEQIINLFLYAM